MPTFSSAQVTDPFLSTNELLAPMLAHITAQEKLGTLDINRQRLGLEQRKLDLQQSGGDALIRSLGGGDGTTGASTGAGGSSAEVPAEYLPYYQEASARTGIPVEVLIAQHKQESGFNPNATGAAGEIGIGQILPSTARSPGFGMQGIDPATLRDPRTNINFSADYLKARGGPRTDFSNPATVDAALKNYNGGGDPNYVANVRRYVPGAAVRAAQAPTPAPPPLNPNAGPRNAGAPPEGAPPGFAPLVPVPGAPTVTGQADPVSMEAVKQASVALLAMPEADAAVAYGPTVKALQARGLAMNAPPEYPGHAALQAIVGQAEATTPAVEPSRQAMRLGGTDVAGPAAGQTTLPPVEQPNTLYQTGLPGITIRGPGNGLAPPPVAATPVTQPAPVTRPPPLQPPPAPSRTIPLEPVLPSGLTASQVRLAASMVQSGAPVADVAAHVEQWRQANLSGRQQAATQAALEAQQNYERQRQYEETVYKRQQDTQAAAEKAKADALAQEAATRDAERLRLSQAEATRQATAAHENTLLELREKIADGSATPVEKARYASAYYSAQQTGAQTVTITDPNDKNQTIPAMIPRRLPSVFPEPEGGALPRVVAEPGAGKQDQLTMEQGKVAGFADRVQQALPIISDTSDAAMSRWQMMLGKAPILANTFVSPEFQLHQQSERNFINAVLRRESGAAIQPSEFAEARQQYIPQPGDAPQVLAQKAQNRQTVLAGMIREAGPGYKPTSSGTAPSAAPKIIQFGPDGKRISP